MSAQTISGTAKLLNVTTVRVHGLIKSGKLVVADEALKVGNKFVKAITDESIEALIVQRANGQTRNGSRQYIVTLSSEQVDELTTAGYELKPRFTKKAAADVEVEDEADEIDEEVYAILDDEGASEETPEEQVEIVKTGRRNRK